MHHHPVLRPFRSVLTILILGVALILAAGPVQAEKSIKVGVYGGYFKESFDKHIFPEFTKATGIKVESVAEPTGDALDTGDALV